MPVRVSTCWAFSVRPKANSITAKLLGKCEDLVAVFTTIVAVADENAHRGRLGFCGGGHGMINARNPIAKAGTAKAENARGEVATYCAHAYNNTFSLKDSRETCQGAQF